MTVVKLPDATLCEAESRMLDRVVASFEDAWLGGEPPSFSGFLEPYEGAQRRRVLHELVHVDLDRRLQAGETVRVEKYLCQYPELGDPREALLALIQWEYRLRMCHEQGPGFEEYHARFPELGDELAVWLARAAATVDAQAATVAFTESTDAPVSSGPIAGYEIVGELGRGGMGIVYKARQLSSGRYVALKLMQRERVSHPDSQRRFRREIQAAARLDHPNIIRVIGGEHSASVCYMVMEYIEGENLQRFVELRGRRPVWQACNFIRQAALGLQHAHECGLVHRDIKPSNLMLAGDAEEATGEGTVKLLDLGLARLDDVEGGVSLSTLTQPGVLMGTIDFIAPEQAQNPHLADVRADLYSLGCTFYYLLLGRVPFAVGSLLEKLDKHRWVTPRPVDRLRPEIPKVVSEIVTKLLAKNPDERYQTAAEVVDALEHLCDPEGCAAARLAQAARSAVVPAPAARPTLPTPTKSGVRPALQPIGLIHTFVGHSDAITSLAVSSDGSQLITGSRDRSLRLWDVATAKPVRWFHGHEGEVRSVALSTSSRRVISGGTDRVVRLWDLHNGNQLKPLGVHTDVVKSVIFTPDSRTAVTASNDRSVSLWDVQTGRKVRSFRGHTGDINSVALAPSGVVAVTGGWDKTLRMWELATGRELQCCGGTFSTFQWSVFMSLSFRPDGQLLVGSSDHTLCLFDLTTGTVTRRYEGHTNWVSSVACSPDGRRAVSGSWDGSVRLWDLESGRQLACLEGHSDQVLTVAFSPDGQHAFSGGADKQIMLWRVVGY